jgi:predicted extracellular nuclease
VKRTRLSILLVLALITALVPITAAPAAADDPITISEIRIDQPGTDNDEYFELAGTPGAALDGLTYVVIGDGTGGSGVIENVTDLTGQSIQGSGFFVAAEGTFTLGTADFTTGLNFENSDNVTHLLVSGFSGSDGDDLDTNDDGTLDVTPWTAVVDSIALVEEENPPAATEFHYGPPSIGPDGSFVPAHVFACTEWQIGPFDPAGGDDTPGAANACGDTPPPVPTVLINELRIDQSGGDDDEYFELTGPAGAELDGFTYLVVGDGDGGSGVIENVTDLSSQVIPGSGLFVAAEPTFTLATADFTTSLNFENSDNVTHMLVYGFTGASGDDLDTDDDGAFDTTPWDFVADSVALIEPGTGERVYGPVTVGPDGDFVPAHVFRCGSGWLIGSFTLGADDTPTLENGCPGPDVDLSEIRIDQPSTDNDEYFELTGAPGTPLADLTYLVIGDGTGGSGVIENVTNLSGNIPASGFFVAAEGTFTLGTADLTTTLNFENSDNVTHMLVYKFTGANGDDLDTDDDGTLDTEPWQEIIDSVALIETVGSGEQVYSSTEVGPDGTFVPGQVFLCEPGWEIGEFDPAGGDDTPGAANACAGPEEDEFGVCAAPATPIHVIQGDGFSSPEVGNLRTVEGVVVGDYETYDHLAGFFLQEEDADTDADPATSEGIFVFNGNNDVVNVGDTVRVKGEVVEYYGLTELTNVTDLVVCATGSSATLPTITMLTSPLPDADREAVEGMIVGFTETMYVTDTYNLHRYGEVWLGMGGVVEQPTNEFGPGAAAASLGADNMLRSILLEDDRTGSLGPADPIPFLHPNGTLRVGDSDDSLVGIMDYAFSQYRLRPVSVDFDETNPRTGPPDVGGDVVIGSMNVLNYWTTIGCGDPCRGAQTQAQFDAQEAALVAAIRGMNADIVALQEIENTGLVDPSNDPNDPSHTPIKTLVAALNAAEVSGGTGVVWAWVGPADHYNDYPIRNEIIYKVGSVTPVGTPDAYADPAFDATAPSGTPYARPPLAQTFDYMGGEFTVVVNHFKSKGSSCGEPNEGADGQGNCNLQRVAEAQALLTFVNELEAIDPDVIVVGDLNSYMAEDPVTTLESGLVNLVTSYDADPWSYNYFNISDEPYIGRGSLDHAFATASAAAQVTDTATWHINADEPRFLDWFDPSKTAGLYRSSDHDPVLIGVDVDYTPPELSVSVDPEFMWPPNHKMRDVMTTITASDDSGTVTVTLMSVTSSEDDVTTPGDKADDIVIVDDTTFELRAERYSNEGRIYTITYEAADPYGNETTAYAEVLVPHAVNWLGLPVGNWHL